MRSGGITGVIAMGLLTAACGADTQQRSASGGLTGLGVGALVGGPVGAIVGGAVGAAGGWAMPEGADTLALNAVRKEKTATSGALSDVGLASSGSSQQSQGRLVRDAQSELQRADKALYGAKASGRNCVYSSVMEALPIPVPERAMAGAPRGRRKKKAALGESGHD